jgi:Tfp pilus assembly protein PilV
MIIALVILIISFLAMIAMLGAKRYEIKAGRQVIAVGARKWAEKGAHRSVHIAKSVVKVAATKHFWTGLGSFFGRKFVEIVWHHPHVRAITKKAGDVVRGKKEIKSKGPVSFYLKDVSDYKEDLPM